MSRDSRQSELRDQDHGDGRGSRRSFHVLYADPTRTTQTRVRDELRPTYRVTTTEDQSTIHEELEEDVDCLVVGDGFDAQTVCELLEYVRAHRPELPVIRFGSAPQTPVLESMLRLETADIVSRETSDGFVHQDEIDCLRTRIDEYYRRSISDIRETVLEISRSLMGAAPDETDVEIEWGLEQVGRRLDADRCLVFDYQDETFEKTHCWARKSVSTCLSEPIDAASFPGFETLSTAFSPYAIPAESDDELDIELPEEFVGDLGIPPDASDEGEETAAGTRRYLRDHSLESLLAVPIIVDWEFEGALVIEQETRRPWPRSLRQQVQALGELIGYTLDRERRRRELARQNERLERFISVISHDLRNPLNVLSGYADLIEETDDPTYIEDVSVAAERMETMIDDLLTLARQKSDLDERRSVDLEEVVRNAWAAVDTADARLETDGLGHVEGDPGRLQQAFENLIRNAIEHAGPTITMCVAETDDGFAVMDDGPGIPPDERERIFEEGYTGGDGTGLGLSIVETVVDAHGWTISVAASEDGGARFEFVTEPESD
ncbi:GAF domain-containing sensor histidine kinase [Natrialbaceae archaeon A-arb3/5]